MSSEVLIQYYLTRKDGEPTLVDELRRVYPSSVHRKCGELLVSSELIGEDAALKPILAFASQVLPSPRQFSFKSIREAAEVLFEAIGEEELHSAWNLHIFPLTRGYSPAGERRAQLIEEAFLDLVKKRRKRWLSSRVRTPERGAARWWIQLLLSSPEDAILSIAGPSEVERLSYVLSDFPAGYVRVPEDKQPPSAAYRKLREAWTRFGVELRKGTRCVDLGASPGGWTWVAAHEGCEVTAVDRSPLRPDLMRHRQVCFVKGDAFSYKPEQPCDWLLSDVIAFPDRVITLIKAWTENKWCRNFCVTIKFRGTEDYQQLEALKPLLRSSCRDFLLLQLSSNKNEVTAVGQIK